MVAKIIRLAYMAGMNEDVAEKYYHPVESGERLGKMSNSELHRLMTDYRWVYAVFNKIAGDAKIRIKSLQSILHKRGCEIGGATQPEPAPNSLARPVAGGGVTDHGLVRYLERVKGIDMRAIEQEMMERIASGEKYFGGAVVVDSDGISYIMREDGVVKSCMPHDWLDEADGVAAQESHKIKRRQQKDAHFKELAAQGIDTSAEAMAAAKCSK